MGHLTPLPSSFYARPAQVVAQALLGQRLVRVVDGQRVSGLIVETEAYCDAEELDLACHGSRNQGRPTLRTQVMFGPPGYAYVYFTYGMHWMFNVVTGEAGRANAVLVRSLEPLEGEAWMAQRRAGRSRTEWTNGPARLCQALGIEGRLNGVCLYYPEGEVAIEAWESPPPDAIACGPRIGLGRTPEPWLSLPWRYWLRDSVFVSRRNRSTV